MERNSAESEAGTRRSTRETGGAGRAAVPLAAGAGAGVGVAAESLPHKSPMVLEKRSDDEHELEHAYCVSYFKRPLGKFDPEQYAIFVKPVVVFSTVEQFWSVYSYLIRPSDVLQKIDLHVFKRGIQPVWEDRRNRAGGKWMVRLKKGLASRIWEDLILAMLGEQFMVGDEICGAVCSIRNQEDIISLWNRTAGDDGVTNRIRDTLRRVLNLPPNTVLEYKKHGDCLKDQTSYRNTDMFVK